jgi:mono/diheme cytochrome c family protein
MQDNPRYEVYEPSRFFADGQASRPYVEGTVARGRLKEDRFYYQGKSGGAGAQPGGVGGGGAQQQSGGPGGGSLQTNTPNAQGPSGTLPGGDVNVRGNAGGRVGVPAGEVQLQSAGDVVDAFPFPVTKEVLDRGQERYQVFCQMCHGMTGFGDGMIVRRGFRRPPSYHDDRLRREPVGHYFDVITNGWGAMPDYAAQIPVEDRWAIIAYIRALQLSQQAPAGSVPQQAAPAGPQQHGGGGEHR